MKKLKPLIPVLLILVSCMTQEQKSNENANEKMIRAIEVNDFLEIAVDSLNKEIVVRGIVKHVCKHSGKRCFIMDTTGKKTIRIEANGQIRTFDKELEGMNIKVLGIVKEKRLKEEFLTNWEKKVKEKYKDIEEGGEHCSAEMENIEQMRNWMKKHKKNYYSIYFIDGKRYEIEY